MSIFRKAQQQIAHTSTVPALGNQANRPLQDVINSEKDFLKTNAKSAADFRKSNDTLKVWAEGEGEDLGDVLGKLSILLDHYVSAQTRFGSHLSTLRLHFKSIRTREEAFSDLKNRKRALGNRIESVEKKLAKMGPENKELMKTTASLKELRAEMESMRQEVTVEEAAIGDYKRRTAKEALGLKCGGLLEFAEKVTIIAEIGKLMIEEIPLGTTSPGMPRAEYHGKMKTDQLLSEATRCVADVQFVPSGPSPAAPRIDPSQFNGSDGNDGIRSSSLDGSNNNYNTTTPIYASHATTAPSLSSPPGSGPNQSLEGDNNNMGTLHSQFSTEGIHDAAADEWGKSTGAAVVGAGALASPDREGPISFPEPSRSQGVSSYDHAAGSDPSQQRRQSGDSRAYEGASDPIGHYGGRADMLETEQRQGGEPSSAYEVHPSRDGVTLSDDPPASYAADPPAAAAAAAAAASVAAEDIPRLATPPLSSPNKSTDAPLLPALRSSSPLPQPAPAVSADDDVSYFQGVGATHAMRNAVRRPSSPSAGAPRLPSGSYSGTSALSPPSGAYEPPAEGRKMTAAAFRRGFNRAPSAQNMGASPSTEHPPAGVFGGAGGDGSVTPHPPGALPPPTEYDSAGNVKPLHIRKRLSGASGPDRTMSGDSFGTAAPPYGQGPAEGSYAVPPAPYGAPQPGSGYGGPSAHGALPAPPAQYHDPWQQQQQQQEGGAGNGFGGIGGGPVHPPPPQPWAQGYGSRPGSRPGSAGGQRGNESSGPGAPPPGYGPPYAAGPQQWH